MKTFLIVLVILIILIAVISYLLVLKLNMEYSEKTKQSIDDVFKKYSFELDSILVVSKKLILALNNQFNRIAVIENYNPETPDIYNYFEIKAANIINIENSGFTTKINFNIQNQLNTITVPSYSKEVKTFCHELLKKILFKKLEVRYPDFKFEYFASSDWECNYIWAYDRVKSGFAYLTSQSRQTHQIINLRKEFFTIDTKYSYLELFLMGQAQQLLVYEKEFLFELFSNLYDNIKNHITPAVEGKIFYDSYSNIIYLSNGINSMQSILLDRIEDVFYRDNRLQFTLLNNKKVINFMADKEFIDEFEKFVIGYNLRKIANNFDYKIDKLINVNTNTKFIIDTSRDRVVYCANLNKFYGFSYMTISFANLRSADVIQNVSNNYVRIITKDDDILDVTCAKPEVAQYVKAQIDFIING